MDHHHPNQNTSELHQHAVLLSFPLFYVVIIKQRESSDVYKENHNISGTDSFGFFVIRTL